MGKDVTASRNIDGHGNTKDGPASPTKDGSNSGIDQVRKDAK